MLFVLIGDTLGLPLERLHYQAVILKSEAMVQNLELLHPTFYH